MKKDKIKKDFEVIKKVEIKKVQLAKKKIDTSVFEKNKVSSLKDQNEFVLTLNPKYLELCKKFGIDTVDSFVGFSDAVKTLGEDKVQILENELRGLFIKFAEIFGIEKLKGKLK